jgi:hypothetical protein
VCFAAAVVSCDDVNEHILTAQLYDPNGSCVGASAGVDVVSGAAVGDNCTPTCLTTSTKDASFTYVTTVCPPYPGDYSSESQAAATDAGDPCVGAFAAYEAYLADGSTCVAVDGGPDAAGEGGDDGGAVGDDGGAEAGE